MSNIVSGLARGAASRLQKSIPNEKDFTSKPVTCDIRIPDISIVL